MNFEKEQVLLAEKNKDLIKSTELYEKIVRNINLRTVDDFINLIFIYFIINDPGEMEHYKIDIDFVNNSYKRIKILIDTANGLYPKNQELLFWENYIYFILLGERPFDEINPMFSVQKQTLVPFFYFYNSFEKKFFKETSQLYESIKEGKSCKDRYIKSILSRYFEKK